MQIDKDTLRAALEEAYMAGWGRSAEGFNAEYPEGLCKRHFFIGSRDDFLDALAAKLGGAE